MSKLPYKTDMPVLLPVQPMSSEKFNFKLKLWHAFPVFIFVLLYSTFGFVDAGPAKDSVFEVLVRWMPLLLKGFVFNLIISILAMGIGTDVGAT